MGIQQILDRFQTMQSRGKLEETWQDLAEVFMPNSADFTDEFTEGDRRNDDIYDSTPMQARRMLAASIDGLIKPKTASWFNGGVGDEDLNSQHEVRLWFDIVDKKMHNAIYSRKAGFVQKSGEVDNDLVTFGTGNLIILLNTDRNGLMFRSTHLKDTFIAENSDGRIDVEYLRLWRTARQAAQQWGEENLSKLTLERLRDNDTKKYPFLWAVEPREDRKADKKDSKNMAFSSTIVDIQGEEIVVESGFKTFPFVVPRWETSEVSVYGRSPAMVALPDALTLNQQAKTLLIAGQKSVDPPMWAFDDAVLNTPKTFPSGITYIDGSAAQDFGGRAPLGVLETGKNLPLGREMQNDTRDQIWRAFFRNVLQLPVDGPEMTATEVLERKEEFIRTIGPVFGQLESDYIGAIVERTFEIMQDADQFPEAPEALIGQDVRFEFRSPVQAAREQSEAFGMIRSLDLMAPLFTAKPEMMDWLNGDEIAKDVPHAFGTPERWINSPEDVQAKREADAQQAQLQQALAAADTGSQVVERVAGIEAPE